jgi:transcriptional regulator with XRE-family HTH domain
MVGEQGASDSVPRIGQGRGQSIRRRRMHLGIKSVREFAERSGVSREAVTAAEHGSASRSTYDRLEAWLDHAEQGEAAARRGDHQVEFRVTGSLGVDVVVRGPVSDLPELESLVTRLIHQLHGRASADGA